MRRVIRCLSVLMVLCASFAQATVLEQVNTNTAQNLSNKTYIAPIFSGTSSGTYTLGGNVTITSPAITNPTITGTVAGGASYTSPTITGTVGGGASYTSPTITGTVGGSASYTSPTITGTVGGGASYTSPTLTGTVGGGASYTAPTITSPSITGTVGGGATYSTPTLNVPKVQSFTKAGLPAAAAAGNLARVSDDVRGVWMDQGSQWFPINAGSVNVKEFGAKGDASTDDTTAIQAALTTGANIYFPCGIYKTTAVLTVSTSNQRITGAGDCAIVRASASTYNVFAFSGVLSGIQFANFRIDGAATDDTNIHIGIYTDVTNTVTDSAVINMTFSGVDATHGLNIGVKLEQDCHRWQVLGNRFTNILATSSNHGYAVLVGKSYYHTISLNRMVGTANTQGRHAVYLTAGASYNTVSDNVIQNYNAAAIPINTLTGANSTGNKILNNLIIAGGDLATNDQGAIEVDGITTDTLVDGNHILNYKAQGIIVNDNGQGGFNERNVVQNNYVYGAGYHGIRACGTKNAKILNNTVVSASTASANTYDGINITSSCAFGTQVNTNSAVMGNVVVGTAHHHALHIDTSAPVPTGARIGMNDFSPGNVGTVTYGTSTVTGPAVNNSLTAVKGISVSTANANNVGSDCLFAASTTCTVTFPTAEPDADYRILIGCNGNHTVWWSSRATTGFTLNANSSSSDNCSWAIIRGATQ